MATRTYQIQLELTNGQTQIAGNFSVTDGAKGADGKNGESITDLEVEPASSTDEGNTYNVYYKVGEGSRQLAGDFLAPRGAQGPAGESKFPTIPIHISFQSPLDRFHISYVDNSGWGVVDEVYPSDYLTSNKKYLTIHAYPFAPISFYNCYGMWATYADDLDEALRNQGLITVEGFQVIYDKNGGLANVYTFDTDDALRTRVLFLTAEVCDNSELWFFVST